MLVNTPPAVSHMVPPLTEFVELMAAKLMVNVHKDQIADKDVPILLERLAEEVAELREQVDTDMSSTNSLEECADIGNFAFLLYQYLRQQGVRNATERFIDEYYDIRPDEGRVYCRKTRSGSPLKEGDEVKGTTRNGRVYIRAQHAITGAALSVSRADLIWWKNTGQWPIERPTYHEHPRPSFAAGAATEDAFWNLRAESPKKITSLPFVSQYKPKGREESPNFGKWVYQRRYAFKLVRCGYYNTAAEAATTGLKDWKEKTRARA